MDEEMESHRLLTSKNQPISPNHHLLSHQYQCNICQQLADEPVLTQCAHLFCWKCLDSHMKMKKTCTVCKQAIKREKLIPLYISTEQNNEPQQNKPVPMRRQAIKNSNAITSQVGFNFRLKNNISMKTNLAGYGYFPCSFVQLFNNYEEAEDLTRPQKEVRSFSEKLETILIGMLLVIVLCIMLNVHKL